jgi:hypothetical protein
MPITAVGRRQIWAPRLGVVFDLNGCHLVGRHDLDPLVKDLEVIGDGGLEPALQGIETVLIDPVDGRGMHSALVIEWVIGVSICVDVVGGLILGRDPLGEQV